MTLEVGDVAPDFTLTDQNGRQVSLSDYRGKYAVVWWIPSTMAEMTPACCDQIARGFGDTVRPDLNVLGLSFDAPELMRIFARRATVFFPLLSDETTEVGRAYGVLRDDEWACFPRKRAFLVDPDGRIAKVYNNIDPDFFVSEVLADIPAAAPTSAGILGRLRSALKV